MVDSSAYNWAEYPPAAFDIVSCYFPETQPEPDGCVKLRPALVINVLKDKKTGRYACEVAYGTTTLKLMQRERVDLIIQNAAHLNYIGLPRATRFDFDEVAILPWNDEFFGCWPGYDSPYIGSLTEDYVREVAYLLMKRQNPPT